MTSTTRTTSLIVLGSFAALAGLAGCEADVSSSTTGTPTGTETGTPGGTGSGTATGSSDGGGGAGMGGAGMGGAGVGGAGVGGGAAFVCGDMGLMCNAPQICLQTVETMGPNSTTTYTCEDDPCAPAALDCTCAMSLCAGGPGSSCSVDMGVLVCQSGGVCAHPTTPIATPDGERPIAELREGDLVLSLHRGELQPVPLLRATKTPVHDHAVVRVTLESGRTMLVSAGHPTHDGRLFGDLTVGSSLGGERVHSLATQPYDESHTYDILPDSDTGTYVAAGALIGSTLR